MRGCTKLKSEKMRTLPVFSLSDVNQIIGNECTRKISQENGEGEEDL